MYLLLIYNQDEQDNVEDQRMKLLEELCRTVKTIKLF